MACTCPFCAALLLYDADQAGETTACPGCHCPFRLPADEMPWECFCRHLDRAHPAPGGAVAVLARVNADRSMAAPTVCGKASDTATRRPA